MSLKEFAVASAFSWHCEGRLVSNVVNARSIRPVHKCQAWRIPALLEKLGRQPCPDARSRI